MFKKLLFKDLTFADIHAQYSDPHDAERFFFDLKWKDGFVCSKCVIPTTRLLYEKTALSELSISALTVVVRNLSPPGQRWKAPRLLCYPGSS